MLLRYRRLPRWRVSHKLPEKTLESWVDKCSLKRTRILLFPEPLSRFCFTLVLKSAPGKWGRTRMGSDGFNRILTGFYLLDPARVRPAPSETHDFKGFRLANRIPWNLVRIWLKTAWLNLWLRALLLVRGHHINLVSRFGMMRDLALHDSLFIDLEASVAPCSWEFVFWFHASFQKVLDTTAQQIARLSFLGGLERGGWELYDCVWMQDRASQSRSPSQCGSYSGWGGEAEIV